MHYLQSPKETAFKLPKDKHQLKEKTDKVMKLNKRVNNMSKRLEEMEIKNNNKPAIEVKPTIENITFANEIKTL